MREAQRLSLFLDEELLERPTICMDHVGILDKETCTFSKRCFGPIFNGLPRSGHGCIDVVLGRDRNLIQGLAGRWIGRGTSFARGNKLVIENITRVGLGRGC